MVHNKVTSLVVSSKQIIVLFVNHQFLDKFPLLDCKDIQTKQLQVANKQPAWCHSEYEYLENIQVKPRSSLASPPWGLIACHWQGWALLPLLALLHVPPSHYI